MSKHATAAMDGGRPKRRRGNLVQTVEEALRREIQGGEIEVGDKLPSEAELTRRFDVSRTVIREAVSSLRLGGLVEARQGVGVFVKAPSAPPPMTGLLRVPDPRRLSEVIELLELRTALEVEAAGLAAGRRSPAQAEALRDRWEEIEARIAAGEATSDVDFDFHLAVADATNNPQFRRMLELMGPGAVPRRAFEGRGEPEPDGYMRHIQAEHRRIVDAVAEGDVKAARAAMREHLEGSQHRYRALLRRG